MEEFDCEGDIPLYFTGKCKTKDDGAIRYYLNGDLHRKDGPALEYPNGYKAWSICGKTSKIEFPDGRKMFL